MHLGFLLHWFSFIISLFLITLVGYIWFFRLRTLIENYLSIIFDVLSTEPLRKWRLLPFYSKVEAVGTYHDRQVIAGIRYVGLGFEWMPIPYIKIKLRDVIRYNYHRLPDFAYIERGWLVLRIKERLPWGIFDRNFERFFTKDYILIMLARLMAVAEDTERGKTLEEIFK